MLFLSVFTAEPGVEHALKVLLRHNLSFDRWKGIRKSQRLAGRVGPSDFPSSWVAGPDYGWISPSEDYWPGCQILLVVGNCKAPRGVILSCVAYLCDGDC